MKIRCFIAVCSFILPTFAWADWTAGSQELWVKGGVALPLNSLESSPSGDKAKIGGPGLSIGGEYLFHVLPQLSLGLDVDYFKLSERSSGAFLTNTNTTANSKTTMLMGVAKYALATDGQIFFPYVLGGLGVHVSTLKLEGTPEPGKTWSSGTAEQRGLMDDTRSSVAAAVGVGTDMSMTPRTVLGLEARYTYLGSVNYNPSALGRTSGITNVSGSEHLIQLLAKVGLQF